MATATVDRPPADGLARLWNRQLEHYPDTRPRTTYLGITVLATIVLYYELYVQGAVATKIIQQFGFTFTQFVFILVIGNAVGAFASLFAGLADRWGRANLVVGGVLVTGLLVLFGLPNAHSKATYTILVALVSLVEGIALVATPALIRDFSPQVGRGAAMGFWTLGPVLGSLVVTEVSSHTLASHPDWRYQFYVCGIAGLVVAVIALVGLRELSPRLRDQLMVSMRDRALIEARAAGIDPETALRGHWRQMLRFDIVGSAFAISVFLLLYYILVAFLVVYFATVFGYSEQRANSLANWYWITNAIALLIAGVLSDKVRVRKPFMVVGAVISMFGTILFALAATHPHTSYYTFAVYFILSAAGGGMAYVAWMAAFTETVEKHNPAATATGLAVWGWVLRLIVTGAFALLTVIVPATTALVDQGPRVESIVAKYPTQVKVLQTVDPVTLGALNTNPNDQAAQVKALSELTKLPALDVVRVVTLGAKLRAGAPLPASDMAFLAANGPKVQASATALQSVSQVPPADLAYLSAHGSKVAKAQTDNPKQWQRWWWISLAGQAIFLPFVFVLAGRWSPRRAREDEIAHERMVEQELAQMGAHSPLAGGMTRAAPDEPRTRRDVT
jgi:MFS transporter, ACS family, D-galactonate transporter